MFRFKTLDFYVFREVLNPLCMGLLVLTFALVVGRLLKLIEMMVNHGVTPLEILELLGYIVPGFLELTLPMAILLGTLLGFGRMSADHELIAARACGVSLYRLAVPVMVLALGTYALASWMAFEARPWANSNLRAELYHLARSRATAGLREKIFNRGFSGLVVYVDKIKPPDTRLAGILISDERNPRETSTIVARKGLVVPDERSETITIRLTDGSVFGTDSDGLNTHISRFGTYDLTIHPGDALGMNHHDPEEMSLAELRGVIAQGRASGHPDYEAETEFAQKFTVPIATLLFALLGITMGLKPARGGQSERFGICLAFFFLYYVLMKAGEALAQAGRLDAFVAMSIPDLFFAVLAFWLFHRSATDRADQSRGPGDAIWDLVDRIGSHHREAA
jgi:lipopolysaccharide export system permease protein